MRKREKWRREGGKRKESQSEATRTFQRKVTRSPLSLPLPPFSLSHLAEEGVLRRGDRGAAQHELGGRVAAEDLRLVGVEVVGSDGPHLHWDGRGKGGEKA